MIRRAFTMRLKPGSLAEYTRHHANVWPELVAEIQRSGIAQITTFQRGLDLFLYSEIRDSKAWDRLWSSKIHGRWAKIMEPLMHLTKAGIVDAGELTEIFHLETPQAAKKPLKSAKKASTRTTLAKATKTLKPPAKSTPARAKK
jgi:L-rhamnose mutarotase